MLREMRIRPRGTAAAGKFRRWKVSRRSFDGAAQRELRPNSRCMTMASKSLERLRKVGDRQTLSLTHYGRKSGRPYEVTIWYLVDKDGLYLVSANAARNWVRNVKVRPAVGLRVGNEVFNGNLRAITDKQERDKVNALTMSKYWYVAPMLRMGQFLMSMGMMRDNTAAFEVILADEKGGWWCAARFQRPEPASLTRSCPAARSHFLPLALLTLSG